MTGSEGQNGYLPDQQILDQGPTYSHKLPWNFCSLRWLKMSRELDIFHVTGHDCPILPASEVWDIFWAVAEEWTSSEDDWNWLEKVRGFENVLMFEKNRETRMPGKLINFQFNIYFPGIVFESINLNLNEFTKIPR